MFHRRTLCLVVLVGASCTVGCTATQTGVEEIAWESDETYDGLRLVSDTRAQRVWIRPDLDLSHYTAIWPHSAGIQYRPVERTAGRPRAGQDAFPISPQARERIANVMSEVFRDELASLQRFEVVDGPGPHVLDVRGALLDVVSFVPPAPISRGDIFLRTVGALTFVVEIRDSETNTIIARVADRRAAERPGNTMQVSNTVTNGAEVRRVMRRWAIWLREGLDSLPDHTPADD